MRLQYWPFLRAIEGARRLALMGLCILLSMLACSASVFADQRVISVRAESQSVALSAAAYIFHDPSMSMRWTDLAGLPGEQRFIAGPLSVGQQQAHFWVRLRVRNEDTEEKLWWLDTGNHYLPDVTLYAPDAEGNYREQSTGATRPFGDRPVSAPNFVFPVLLPAGETVDIYLQARTLGILNHTLKINLWQPEAHRAHTRSSEVQWFMFLGLSLGLALFNLFLYFSLRDVSYLLYVVTVFAQVWRTSDNGFAYEYWWPTYPLFEQVFSRGLSMIAVLVASHLFVSRFIELPRAQPVIYRRLNGLQWANTVLIAFSMCSVFTSAFVPVGVFQLSQLAFVLGVVVYVISVLAILVRWSLQGNRRARSLLEALAPVLILTGLVDPLLTLMKVDFEWTIPPMMLGAGIGMILMSRALASRFHEVTAAKEDAQHELLVGLQHKERELEHRVAQRTQDLALANEAFQGVLENAQDAVILVRHHGKITHWNRQAEILLGWSREEAQGQYFADLIWPHNGAPEQVVAMLAKERLQEWQDSLRVETIAVRKDGTQFPIELSTSPIKRADHLEFGFFLRDITQRRKAEEEIQISFARQQELIDLKSRFISMASHEFRTPMATILSSTELLKHYGEKLTSGESAKLHNSVEDSVQRMTQMLDDVLLIGKSDAGMLEFQPESIDLRVFCQTLTDEINGSIKKPISSGSCIELSTDLNVGLAEMDLKLLRQILSNLLTNAIKYSPQSSKVQFKVSLQGDAYQFSVSDNGIGIPPEDIPTLFDSFSRASNVGEIVGTGLGLSIVKRAVDMHGGTIHVKSQLGSGSEFIVVLPAQAPLSTQT